MINGRTYYDILGLDRNGLDYAGNRVSQESIDRRYRALKFGNNYEDRLSDWEMGPVEEAYRVLSDIALRREYDEKLKNGGFYNYGVSSVEPVQEIVEPVQEIVEPVQEIVEPVQEIVEPVQEVVEPVQEIVEPVQEIVEPVQEVVEPVQEVVEPVQEIVEPAQEIVEPVQEVEEPAQEIVEPVQEIVEPVQEIVEPVQKVVEPVQKVVEPVQEIVKQQQTEKNNVNREYEETKKRNINKIMKGAAIVLGSSIFFGPIGTVVSGLVVGNSKKLKLEKLPQKAVIKEVQTPETILINESNKKLQDEVTNLLQQPLNSNQRNYKLEIAKLKYKNNVELLNQMIEYKQNCIVGLGDKAHNRLHLFALEKSLEASILWLKLDKKINEKKSDLLSNYEPGDKKDELSKVNEKISKTTEEMQKEGITRGQVARKKFKLRKLNEKRLATIENMALKKDSISKWQLLKAVFNQKESTIEGPVEETEKIR